MSPILAPRAPDEPLQLSLLQGFPASAAAAAGPALAAQLPVARVLIESSLPHLDRPFDYSVPAALDAAAQPGVRVKVKFNGQELAGYLLERVGGIRRRPPPRAAAQGGLAGPGADACRRGTRRPGRGALRRHASATCCASPCRRGWPNWRRNSPRTAVLDPALFA